MAYLNRHQKPIHLRLVVYRGKHLSEEEPKKQHISLSFCTVYRAHAACCKMLDTIGQHVLYLYMRYVYYSISRMKIRDVIGSSMQPRKF